jgi:ankyrin repeat protein
MSRTIKPFAFLLIVMGVGGCGASLMELSELGDLQAVQRALHDGHDVNARTVQGQSPLTLAAREGHLDVVRALIQAGAELDVRAWTIGANSRTRIYRHLAPELTRERFVNVDSSGPQSLFMAHRSRYHANLALRDGKTALMFAAERGHVEIVKALIQAGADVRKKSGSTRSRLYDRRGHAGVDANSRTPKRIGYLNRTYPQQVHDSPDRKTAQDLAYENGHLDIVNLLIKADLRLLEVSNR